MKAGGAANEIALWGLEVDKWPLASVASSVAGHKRCGESWQGGFHANASADAHLKDSSLIAKSLATGADVPADDTFGTRP